MLGVLYIASAAHIDVLSGFDKHVIGRDDIGDRRLARVVSCDPKGDGDIVRGISKSNGEKTMEAEKELGAAVVECFGGSRTRQELKRERGRTVHIGLWAEGCEAGEGGVDVGVDAVWIWIWLGRRTEPLLGEGGHGRRRAPSGQRRSRPKPLFQMGNFERPISNTVAQRCPIGIHLGS